MYKNYYNQEGQGILHADKIVITGSATHMHKNPCEEKQIIAHQNHVKHTESKQQGEVNALNI